MNITILNVAGYPPSALGMGAHSLEITAETCLDHGAVEGNFVDFSSACVFAQGLGRHYYVAGDNVSGGFTVFTRD